MIDDLEATVLHWVEDHSHWEGVPWEDWKNFVGILASSVGLPGLSAGVHHFAIAVSENGETLNIIPHKVLLQDDGRRGPDNFAGWTREDYAENRRLYGLRKMTKVDERSLAALRAKGGRWYDPPPDSIAPLRQALPYLVQVGSAAERFLLEVGQASAA
ncbi:hypothetical protein P7D22_19525 [Lichenihabitans sp. Uapishka_5]|uniref:hypothetical protein n=1 Tax=Lichenihabitans sp. Uapishka_5 TaxID=3037302 RepID=UPI0029E81EC7|nr:hypothetical protein [Lichenihabitans sp. Uapishka_5]MDX7953358.1 hypothetical protein [Lichenihabitans sp. Uapishka_5]